jgi:hypothetical protein
VRFAVVSDQRAEIHVHGYDKTINVRLASVGSLLSLLPRLGDAA